MKQCHALPIFTAQSNETEIRITPSKISIIKTGTAKTGTRIEIGVRYFQRVSTRTAAKRYEVYCDGIICDYSTDLKYVLASFRDFIKHF